MRKAAAGLLAMLLLAGTLCACSASAPLIAERESTRLLRLSIPKGVSPDAARGLDMFIAKVDDVSDGRVRIEKSACDDPIAALDEGSDLIFAPNADAARANGDFLAYTSPFYFLDHTHLTVTLNSDSFRSLIEEKTSSLLGASPLAAFYGGSRIFLSDESDLLDDCEGWQDVRASVSSEEDLLAVVLESLGAEVSLRSPDELMEGFLDGRYRTIDCETRELKNLVSGKINNADITGFTSFHAASVGWLLLSDTARDSLTEFEYAVLREAAAYGLAENDGAILAEEQEAMEYASALGVEVYPIRYDDFCERADIAFLGAVRYRNLWDWETHDAVRLLAQSGAG